MKLERVIEIETNDIQIGDRIHVGEYTATCQKITPKAALFLLDQYITERGDWREAVQSDDVLSIFADIRDRMIPFYNGELFKVPFSYGLVYPKVTRFRPLFLISMKEEDATKKSAPENEETIQDVLDTFNKKQRLVLCYLVGKAIKDAKKGKTLKEHAQEVYLMKNHTVPYTQVGEEASREILEKVLDILGG